METEAVLRYRALSEAKRLEYQALMKQARTALMRRYQSCTISNPQFCREYEAASAAILNLVEGADEATGVS